MTEEHPLGWLTDQEDWDFLQQSTILVSAAPGDFQAPAKMSYREILMIQSQARLSACVGCMESSGCEELEFLVSGEKKQFSRWFAYRQAQIASGIQGDNGAIIARAVEAGTTIGNCFEDECEYPSQYNTKKFNDSQMQSAIKKRFLGHQAFDNAGDAFRWQAEARGPIFLGFGVTPDYDALQGAGARVTVKTLQGRSRGGHAVLLAGYQKSGEMDQIGSWGTGWGDNGWAPWDLEAIDWIARRDGLFGVSNILGFDQTRVDRVVDFGENM